MSKYNSRKKAEKKYPSWRNKIGDEFSENSAYYGYVEGYQQAVEDIKNVIFKIIDIMAITEKIYFDQHTGKYNVEKRNVDDIEYIRKDALIEKALTYLNEISNV